MYSKIALTICFLAFSLVGCSKEPVSLSQQIQQLMSDKKIEYSEIIHTEVVEYGLLIFYVDNERNCWAGYIENYSSGWKWSGRQGIVSLDEGGYIISDDTGMPIPLDWGIITDPSVSSVKIKDSPVKIITTVSGVRLWIHLPKIPTPSGNVNFIKGST